MDAVGEDAARYDGAIDRVEYAYDCECKFPYGVQLGEEYEYDLVEFAESEIKLVRKADTV